MIAHGMMITQVLVAIIILITLSQLKFVESVVENAKYNAWIRSKAQDLRNKSALRMLFRMNKYWKTIFAH